MRSDAPLLAAIGVEKSFGPTPALRGVDFDVARGEIVAVMGPSGSGKSTLLHCLAGILIPDKGEIWFDGSQLSLKSDEDRSRLRRTDFGFVFQFGQLVPELTAEDNVALPQLLNGTKRPSAYKQARAWLDKLEIGDLYGRRSGELSGGQAQRVALARCLIANPKVIFADEPTGSLDSLAGERVMELIVRHAHDASVTVILVTHDPRVAAYADRDVIVRDGQVSTLNTAELSS